MKKISLVLLMAFALVACDRIDNPNPNTPPSAKDVDNTGINVRDRDARVKTPFDQSESAADRTISQKIRQAIVSDDSLSTNAKNIKIITIDGVVTLRGPVSSAQEKAAIEQKVNSIQGISKVDNQLEVTRIK